MGKPQSIGLNKCEVKYNDVKKSSLPELNVEKKLDDLATAASKITWNDSWALGCMFVGRDFLHVQTSGSECGNLCDRTLDCTHFSWNNNTCWLKYGPISKSNAIPTSDNSTTTCGLSRADLKKNICGININFKRVLNLFIRVSSLFLSIKKIHLIKKLESMVK